MDRISIIDPRGSNKEAARQMGHQLVDLIVDHLGSLDDQPVRQEKSLPDAPPPNGRSWPELVEILKGQVIPGSMQVAHPRFFGHMDSGPLWISILGDLLTAALNQNMLTWELSPLATTMERAVIDWLVGLTGLPEQADGTLVSGGTAANLTGLLLAREHAPARRVILSSQQAHYSVTKAARVLGLGAESVRSVPVDAQFRMDPLALSRLLQELPEPPLAVLATAGTTSTGSVDPLVAIAEICKEHGIWLHVDAAHGGGALLSPRARGRLQGIEHADSIALDPHKWMLQPKGIGAVLVRNPALLHDAFSTGAPYLARRSGPLSQGQRTLQGSRRWDALRLWLAWQHLGESGLAALIDHSLEQTGYLVDAIARHPELEIAHSPDLNLLCFRLVGDDQRTEDAHKRLVESGIGFVSLTTLHARRWFRAVLLNPSVTRADIDRVLKAIVS